MTWAYKQKPYLTIVKEQEENPKWQVYGYHDCEWTTKVLNILKTKNEKNITFHDVQEEGLCNALIQKGYVRVPIVFRNGELLGGYADTLQFLRSTPLDANRK